MIPVISSDSPMPTQGYPRCLDRPEHKTLVPSNTDHGTTWDHMGSQDHHGRPTLELHAEKEAKEAKEAKERKSDASHMTAT